LVNSKFFCFSLSLVAASISDTNFLNSSSKDGLSASYEVKTQAEKDALLNSPNISAANKSKIVLNTAASGAHFHVEKP
jgi:hypothetical protein